MDGKIGKENIKPAAIITICSKHFEDECVNRTLNIIRLKDDVVPTLFPVSIFSVYNVDTLSGKSFLKEVRT